MFLGISCSLFSKKILAGSQIFTDHCVIKHVLEQSSSHSRSTLISAIKTKYTVVDYNDEAMKSSVTSRF